VGNQSVQGIQNPDMAKADTQQLRTDTQLKGLVIKASATSWLPDAVFEDPQDDASDAHSHGYFGQE